MSEWQPIETLPGASRVEIIVLLRDGSVRTAARGLGTILLGPYGQAAPADNWPTHWMPLPDAPASGIETEGHDAEERHGAKHASPAPKGDAHDF